MLHEVSVYIYMYIYLIEYIYIYTCLLLIFGKGEREREREHDKRLSSMGLVFCAIFSALFINMSYCQRIDNSESETFTELRLFS